MSGINAEQVTWRKKPHRREQAQYEVTGAWESSVLMSRRQPERVC